MRWGIAALACVVLAVGCGGDDADVGAELACGEMAALGEDWGDGLVTRGELRGRLRVVVDRAEGADDEGVRVAARDALAAATSGDDERLADAVRRMALVCEAHAS